MSQNKTELKKLEKLNKRQDKLINSLIGQVMKLSKGKANPMVVRGIIMKKIME